MGMGNQASLRPRKRKATNGPAVRPVARLIPADKVRVSGEVLVLPRGLGRTLGIAG